MMIVVYCRHDRCRHSGGRDHRDILIYLSHAWGIDIVVEVRIAYMQLICVDPHYRTLNDAAHQVASPRRSLVRGPRTIFLVHLLNLPQIRAIHDHVKPEFVHTTYGRKSRTWKRFQWVQVQVVYTCREAVESDYCHSCPQHST